MSLVTEASEASWYPGHWASIDPARVAAIDASTGATLTYGELHSFAMRFARAMRRRGLGVGDHIAWCLENRLEFLAVAWGSVYAGLHYTTVSHTLHAEEIAYIVNDCGAKAFVASPYKATEAAALLGLTPGVEHRFALGGQLDGHERLEPVLATESDAPMDGLIEGVDMLYSSGTTGKPKGVKVQSQGGALGSTNPMVMMSKAFMIISGGVNIYPQEAENVLAVHPKVYDVAVFGVPNPEFGEEVKAVVQPIDWPATDAAHVALEAELIAHCREHLASLKCPRSIDFRRELPRHATGKLYKRQLRDEYWGGRSDIIVHETGT